MLPVLFCTMPPNCADLLEEAGIPWVYEGDNIVIDPVDLITSLPSLDFESEVYLALDEARTEFDEAKSIVLQPA